MKKKYDLSDEFEEELMNNRLYGCLTDGVTWIFLQYEHTGYDVHTRIIKQMTVETKNFFLSLHEVVKVTVNLIGDLIFNKA
jgi:hypothetical protein